MKYYIYGIFFLVGWVIAASDSLGEIDIQSEPIPLPRHDPKGWFSRVISEGVTAKEIEALWATGPKPDRITGEKLIIKINENTLSASEVAADAQFKEIINPDSDYWYWSKQGPMSDHQMHIILHGTNLADSIVVYAKIQERPCL